MADKKLSGLQKLNAVADVHMNPAVQSLQNAFKVIPKNPQMLPPAETDSMPVPAPDAAADEDMEMVLQRAVQQALDRQKPKPKPSPSLEPEVYDAIKK